MLPGPALGIEHIRPVATPQYIEEIGQRSNQFLCHKIAPGYTADDDGVLYENTCQAYSLPEGVVGSGQEGCSDGQILHAVTNNACKLECAAGFHAVEPHKDHYHEYTGIETARDLHCGIDGGMSTTTLVCAEDHSHSHGKKHGKLHDHSHGKHHSKHHSKDGKSSKSPKTKGEGKKGKSQGITDTAKSASGSNVVAVGSASAVGALSGFVGAIFAAAVTQKVTRGMTKQ